MSIRPAVTGVRAGVPYDPVVAETRVDTKPAGNRWVRIVKLTFWSLVYDAGLAIPGGFVLMLTVGLVHHQWWPAMPTIGYLTAAGLVFLTRQVITALTAKSTYLARDKAALEAESP